MNMHVHLFLWMPVFISFGYNKVGIMFINILCRNLGTEKLNMLIRVGDRIQTWDLHVSTMLCSFLYSHYSAVPGILPRELTTKSLKRWLWKSSGHGWSSDDIPLKYPLFSRKIVLLGGILLYSWTSDNSYNQFESIWHVTFVTDFYIGFSFGPYNNPLRLERPALYLASLFYK